MKTPFYDPNESYEYNYKHGPFGVFAQTKKAEQKQKYKEGKGSAKQQPQFELFGHKLFSPFGIPAGPLVNANFVTAALQNQFDVCVYKTVRTIEYPCHPQPNVLAVHVKKLSAERKKPLVADSNYTKPLSITNSFGVPSTNPKIWQADMAQAVQTATTGQVVIGSFQGTSDGSGSVEQYINDFVTAAELVKETGAPILEANLSCPNEGTAHLLCFDIERTANIAKKIKQRIGKNTPLILKIAYFESDDVLKKFIKTVSPYCDGIAAINTIPATIITKDKQQALPGNGRERSGVCGTAIKWAGLEMTKRLKKIKKTLGLDYTILGVGGVTSARDFQKYRDAGADIVMSATGAMWNPDLGQKIRRMVQQ